MSNDKENFDRREFDGDASGEEELTIEDFDGRLAEHLRLGALESPTTAASPGAGRAKILIISGADEGRKFELTGNTVTIGRALDNDVVLTDLAVSRRHMTIEREQQNYFVQDLGSGNGTLLNGRDEDGRALLRHGDRLEMGNTVMRFDCPRPTLAYSGRRNPTEAPPVPPAGRGPKGRRQAAQTTVPPEMRQAPDDVATRGAPIAPRPTPAQLDGAPPPPQPGPGPLGPPAAGPPTSLAPGASPLVAGPSGPIAKPMSPFAQNLVQSDVAGQRPPTAGGPLGPQANVGVGSGPPGGVAPSYPQAPPNYGSMSAVDAMRPRSHSQAQFAVPQAIPAKERPNWIKPAVVVAGVASALVISLVLFGRDEPVAVKEPGVDTVTTVKKPAAPRVALLTGADLPTNRWGTFEPPVKAVAPVGAPDGSAGSRTAEEAGTEPGGAADTAPTPSGAVPANFEALAKQADELYRQKEFGKAAKLLRSETEGSKSQEASSLRTQADQLAALGEALRAADTHKSAKQHSSVVERLLTARAADKQLSGVHQDELTRDIQAAASLAADAYLKKGNTTRARRFASYASPDRKTEILAAAKRQANRKRPTSRVEKRQETKRAARKPPKTTPKPARGGSDPEKAKKMLALGKRKASKARTAAERKKAVTILKKARSLAGSGSKIGRQASALINDLD